MISKFLRITNTIELRITELARGRIRNSQKFACPTSPGLIFNRGYVIEEVFREIRTHLSKRQSQGGRVIRRRAQERSGQAVLVTVLFLLFSSAALLVSFSSISLKETDAARLDIRGKQSYFLAEAGVEDLAWRIKNTKQYAASQTIALNGSTATIVVYANGSAKEIKSTGLVAAASRSIALTLRPGVGVGFYYGIHAGQGGFRIEQSADVFGNIYSNGRVWGGSSSGGIHGDVYAAGMSQINNPVSTIYGQAQAHAIDHVTINGNATTTTTLNNVNVLGNAYADILTYDTIGKDAYYHTSIVNTTVAGKKYPGSPQPQDLPTIPMPISDAQISDWEETALAGGTYAGPCPYVIGSGTVTLGPIKINCNFVINNNAVVTLTGPVWVAGNFTIALGNPVIKLAASYGSGSGVLVADNPADRFYSSIITVSNAAQVQGSGTAGSFLMLVSQNNAAELGSLNQAAITEGATASSGIFYAPHGTIVVGGSSAAVNEITGYHIHLSSNGQIVYNSGLVNTLFTSGPSGGWNIQSWNEVK